MALARALVVEPAVLLLDEPLGALDVALRRQVQGELKAVQRRVGTTFVHVTHDQEEAMALADLLVVMNQGRIEDAGPPDRVYLRPRTRFTATFLGDSNLIEGRVVAAGEGWVEIDDGARAGPGRGRRWRSGTTATWRCVPSSSWSAMRGSGPVAARRRWSWPTHVPRRLLAGPGRQRCVGPPPDAASAADARAAYRRAAAVAAAPASLALLQDRASATCAAGSGRGMSAGD